MLYRDLQENYLRNIVPICKASGEPRKIGTLEHIALGGRTITDQELRHLLGWKKLQTVKLTNTHLTKAGRCILGGDIVLAMAVKPVWIADARSITSLDMARFAPTHRSHLVAWS